LLGICSFNRKFVVANEAICLGFALLTANSSSQMKPFARDLL